MIKEAYCSFKVAKLLEKKGFNIITEKVYDNQNKLAYQNSVCWQEKRLPYISAPTHQMAMAWLREVYNIDIIIFHEKLPNDCYWARIERNLFTEFEQEPEYNSYEDAVEDALKYTLENLL